MNSYEIACTVSLERLDAAIKANELYENAAIAFPGEFTHYFGLSYVLCEAQRIRLLIYAIHSARWCMRAGIWSEDKYDTQLDVWTEKYGFEQIEKALMALSLA